MKRLFTAILLMALTAPLSMAQIQKDTFTTNQGELEIWHIGHGTLMFKFGENIIHVDPYSKLTDYNRLPKADLILITHEHGDHLDTAAINAIRKPSSDIILTSVCREIIREGQTIANHETTTWNNLLIEAVPAYNLVHKRDNGEFYHPKGRGNGYILNFGDKRVYVAGDTENIPEMKAIQNIDIAFLPMNLPYTMTPEMTAKAAKLFNPAILYPYHYGDTDTNILVKLMKDNGKTEVRIR
ncbi:MBL fold metallo-hydrolase [Geofilum rubicundum]|uniref:Putative metal-dependent hydrolase n=1 Tax=Geofilum rubicundum JCM 15548 TaxID=1236989 RepID=A0A0E9M1B7_9BACT|nr:MBL fold metallo-hydrolase [Geofilum rubicundum]GAO30920.1 putative metal-dependent hydrolase [Geofilum rubicundum JCM 15548]